MKLYRYLGRYLATGLFICLIGGCAPNQAFVRAVDDHVSIIIPEYKDYVSNDENLADTSKEIRMQSADTLIELIESAKGEL